MAESPAAPHARPHAAGSGLFSRGRSGRRVAASLRFEFSLPCWLTRFRTFPGVTGHRDGAFSDEALKNRAVDLSSSRSVEASRCRQPPGDVTPGNRLSGGCLASSSFLEASGFRFPDGSPRPAPRAPPVQGRGGLLFRPLFHPRGAGTGFAGQTRRVRWKSRGVSSTPEPPPGVPSSVPLARGPRQGRVE